MLPPPVTSPADFIENPPAFEGTTRRAVPPPPPPPDDRLELLRAFVQRATAGRMLFSARVLIRRAVLGDREAWYAVAGDIGGASTTATWRVAERLGDGDLDAAVACAAQLSGETVDAWLSWARAEAARKAGAP